jgi:hypothetical protein
MAVTTVVKKSSKLSRIPAKRRGESHFLTLCPALKLFMISTRRRRFVIAVPK